MTERRSMENPEQGRPTREQLEAMRQEFTLPKQPGGGLPFNLDADIKQARMIGAHGITQERWASLRGVSVEYAYALQRYVSQL